mmetsp:Transcript_137446/g.293739  ORF Transcript_137446/g.293739 Transcript_137446/m.293739 type:complete len:399 (+) Transcript_137446:779-1975(+)
MAQRVRILEKKGAILFEGVRKGQEHRLGLDDLLVDHSQEVRDLFPPLLGHPLAKKSAELAVDGSALLLKRLDLIRWCLLLLGRPQCTTRRHSALLQWQRLLQEKNEALETLHCTHNTREVAGELRGPEDVIEVPLAGCRTRIAEHAHSLRSFAHSCMDAAGVERKENLTDAEDELRQVESPQDVLRKNLPLHHQAEGLLRRGGGVIVVHKSCGHLHEVGARHGCDHAHGITIHAPTHSQHDDTVASALRLGHGLQHAWFAIGIRALVALPRSVRKVVTWATTIAQSRQNVSAVPQQVARLAHGHHWEYAAVSTAEALRQELRQAGDTFLVPPLVGHHRQLQATDLEGGRLLGLMRRRLQRAPGCEGPSEGAAGQGAKDRSKGPSTHTLRLRRIVLEQS